MRILGILFAIVVMMIGGTIVGAGITGGFDDDWDIGSRIAAAVVGIIIVVAGVFLLYYFK